jgi:type IV pilus assembly protein PilE
MRRRCKTNQNGFSLIEMIIIVAVVAILGAIALPSYSDYTSKTRRKDAMGSLNGLAQAMERHFTENNTYVSAANGDPTTSTNGVPPVAAVFPSEAPLDGNDKYYDLRITAVSPGSFTLRAIPKNAQSGDGIIEMTSNGGKFWDSNNDGDVADAGENDWN